MGKEALSIHATTFQFFTRNPRGSKVKALDIDDINFKEGYVNCRKANKQRIIPLGKMSLMHC